MAINDYLLDQFADDVLRTGGGQSFFAQLDEWQPKVVERTFSMNVVDVTVNFVDGWAEIADALEDGRSHRVALAELRAAARSASPRST